VTVDFHSHTSESDGTLSPADLVARMRARGVSWFSITDHDTLRAYDGLDTAGLRLIPGIEINTTWNGADVHILGYRIPLGPSPLAHVLEANRTHRRSRIDRMVEKLAVAGYPVTLDEILAESGGGHALGRPHVAKALVRRGHVRDIDAAFRELLSFGKPAYTPSHHITAPEAIDVIRAAGGIAVVAHPGRLWEEKMLDALIEHGLDGIEVFYPTHTTQQRAAFRAIAARHNLVMTAGADFHDPKRNPNGVGVDVDPDDIRPFLDLVAA
jgi:hypothetical protein